MATIPHALGFSAEHRGETLRDEFTIRLGPAHREQPRERCGQGIDARVEPVGHAIAQELRERVGGG